MVNRRKQVESGLKNYNTRFVLPMVGIYYRRLPSNFFNSYITDDYKIILVFDLTVEDPKLDMFIEGMRETIYYDSVEKREDELCVILRVDVGPSADDNKYNYDCFIKGHYSEFSQSYKSVITAYFGNSVNKDNYLVKPYNVIYPQEYKRKQIAERLFAPKDREDGLKLIKEVLDAPDLSKEIYKPIEQLIGQEEVTEKYDNK